MGHQFNAAGGGIAPGDIVAADYVLSGYDRYTGGEAGTYKPNVTLKHRFFYGGTGEVTSYYDSTETPVGTVTFVNELSNVVNRFEANAQVDTFAIDGVFPDALEVYASELNHVDWIARDSEWGPLYLSISVSNDPNGEVQAAIDALLGYGLSNNWATGDYFLMPEPGDANGSAVGDKSGTLRVSMYLTPALHVCYFFQNDGWEPWYVAYDGTGNWRASIVDPNSWPDDGSGFLGPIDSPNGVYVGQGDRAGQSFTVSDLPSVNPLEPAIGMFRKWRLAANGINFGM